jgi:hypothetical protein
VFFFLTKVLSAIQISPNKHARRHPQTNNIHGHNYGLCLVVAAISVRFEALYRETDALAGMSSLPGAADRAIITDGEGCICFCICTDDALPTVN